MDPPKKMGGHRDPPSAMGGGHTRGPPPAQQGPPHANGGTLSPPRGKEQWGGDTGTPPKQWGGHTRTPPCSGDPPPKQWGHGGPPPAQGAPRHRLRGAGTMPCMGGGHPPSDPPPEYVCAPPQLSPASLGGSMVAGRCRRCRGGAERPRLGGGERAASRGGRQQRAGGGDPARGQREPCGTRGGVSTLWPPPPWHQPPPHILGSPPIHPHASVPMPPPR